jgi:heat-inducible transcriptional repressor
VLTNKEDNKMKLTDRQKKILSGVVEKYISTGEPVGSKVICQDLNVSSATVRNDMAVLTSEGFLEQTHTSSGRIPSSEGIKFYINNLMGRYDISDKDRQGLSARLSEIEGEPKDVLKRAAGILSELTGMTAIASTPFDSRAVIKKAELVPLSAHSALVVVMMSTGVVKTELCRSDTEIDMNAGRLFYSVVNSRFVGHMISDISVADIQSISLSLGDRVFQMTPFLSSVVELSKKATVSDMIVEGKEKLLNFGDLSANVTELIDVLANSNKMATYFNNQKEQTKVYIGSENFNPAFLNTAMIISKYSINSRQSGVIGVIGPVRLDYSRMIPAVKYLTSRVSDVLTESVSD